MDQGELFSEGARAVADGMADVRIPKPKREYRNVPWEEMNAIILKAIADGRHSVEHKFLCDECREWVDALFHVNIFACPKKWSCRKCAAKMGVEGAAEKTPIGGDVAAPADATDSVDTLPAGMRPEDYGLPI